MISERELPLVARVVFAKKNSREAEFLDAKELGKILQRRYLKPKQGQLEFFVFIWLVTGPDLASTLLSPGQRLFFSIF